jgi:2-phospho-L-lactate guanylyltransferase
MEEIVIVPDSELDGTNVLVLPTNIDFEFSYGPGSYTRHLKSATMLEAEVLVVADSPFSFDIDDPDDLHHVL